MRGRNFESLRFRFTIELVKTNIKILFLLITLAWGSVAFAELDKDFRPEFPQLLKDLCYSTVDYDLDRPFEVVKAEYHQTQNCIFDDAFYQTTKRIFKEIHEETSGQGTEGLEVALEYNTLGNQCDKKASEIRRLQEANGLRTRCLTPEQTDDRNTYQTLQQPYSACRVGEIALAEWCGYQKYLWAKMNDEKTFATQTEVGKSVYNFEDWKKQSDQRKAEYRYESEKSRQGLLDTITFYRKFEQNYRLHAWLKAVENRLKRSRELWVKMRAIFDLYPEKFINAATP